MGYTVLGGLWEPGTAVSLFAAPDGVLRSDGSGLVGRRLADVNGSVGFDGLDVGDRFIASGFDVYGRPLEITVRAQAEDAGNEVAQPPVQPAAQTVGTQEARVVRDPVAAPDAILHTGIPAGCPYGVALAA